MYPYVSLYPGVTISLYPYVSLCIPISLYPYISQVQGEFHISDLSHAVHQLHLQLLHRGAAVELDTVQRILSEDVYVGLRWIGHTNPPLVVLVVCVCGVSGEEWS